MNIEVEIKVKVENLQEAKDKVSKVGKLIKSIDQIDEYYVPPHRNFIEKQPYPTEWLRIRTNPDKVVLEYSRSVNQKADGEHDYAEEYETAVEAPDELRKILEFLDFKKVVTVEKHREYWMCDKIEIALDEVKGLGAYVEAEAKGDFEDNKEAKRECIKFLETLGIKNVDTDYIKQGYARMLYELAKSS